MLICCWDGTWSNYLFVSNKKYRIRISYGINNNFSQNCCKSLGSFENYFICVCYHDMLLLGGISALFNERMQGAFAPRKEMGCVTHDGHFYSIPRQRVYLHRGIYRWNNVLQQFEAIPLQHWQAVAAVFIRCHIHHCFCRTVLFKAGFDIPNKIANRITIELSLKCMYSSELVCQTINRWNVTHGVVSELIIILVSRLDTSTGELVASSPMENCIIQLWLAYTSRN